MTSNRVHQQRSLMAHGFLCYLGFSFAAKTNLTPAMLYFRQSKNPTYRC